MRISKVHAGMRDEIRSQGPLVNAQTGLRSRHNRGVRRAWKRNKRQEAETRQVQSRLVSRTSLLRTPVEFDDPFNGMTVGEFRDQMDAEWPNRDVDRFGL